MLKQTKEVRERAEQAAIERLGAQKKWDKLIREMDKQDENREQREQYHEVSCRDVSDRINTGRRRYGKPKEYREYSLSNVNTAPWEDLIFDSPEEIDELVSERIAILGLRKLSDKQKEALFYRHARGGSVQNTAALMKCGDRNVIKHIQAGVKKFQKYAAPILKARDEQSYPLTTTHRRFLEWMKNPMLNKDLYIKMLKSGELEAWFEKHDAGRNERTDSDGNQ